MSSNLGKVTINKNGKVIKIMGSPYVDQTLVEDPEGKLLGTTSFYEVKTAYIENKKLKFQKKTFIDELENYFI